MLCTHPSFKYYPQIHWTNWFSFIDFRCSHLLLPFVWHKNRSGDSDNKQNTPNLENVSKIDGKRQRKTRENGTISQRLKSLTVEQIKCTNSNVRRKKTKHSIKHRRRWTKLNWIQFNSIKWMNANETAQFTDSNTFFFYQTNVLSNVLMHIFYTELCHEH